MTRTKLILVRSNPYQKLEFKTMFEEFANKEPDPARDIVKGSSAKIERFKALWVMFKKGTDWINKEYETHILPDGRRHYDPHLETQIKRFEDEVIKPMDLLWVEMTEGERNACEPLKLNPPSDCQSFP